MDCPVVNFVFQSEEVGWGFGEASYRLLATQPDPFGPGWSQWRRYSNPALECELSASMNVLPSGACAARSF